MVACEDTRRTRVLLDRYGVSARLVSYHEHNEAARSAELVERMRAGAVVALVSDAGMPLVSDPGFVLVRGVRRGGAAGRGAAGAVGGDRRAGGVRRCRPTSGTSHGFLPRKKGELRRLLAEPRRDAGGVRVAAPGAGHAGGAGASSIRSARWPSAAS